METLADGGVFGGEWGAGKRRHISWRGGENGVFRFIRSVAAGRGGSRLLLRDFENGGEEIAGAGRSFTGGRVASGKSRRGAGSAPGLPTSLFRGPGGPRPLPNGDGAAADALRKATADLRLQLFKKRLALAAAFPNQPEKAKLYCPQNLLEGPAPEK